MMDRRRLLMAGSSAFSVPLLWGRAATSSEFSDGYAMGDGVRLHFVRSGEGPLMLFLHGHPDSASLYQSKCGNSAEIIWSLRQTFGGTHHRMHRKRSKPTPCRGSLGTCTVCSIILVENNAL